MNQDEFKKLQQAGQLIKSGDYKKARAILKTMPSNEKAQAWLLKLDEKEMFGQAPQSPKKQTQPAPQPVFASSDGDMPIAPKVPKKRFNFGKWAMVTVAIFAVIGIGIFLLLENAQYNMGLNNLEEGKIALAGYCTSAWRNRYSEAECQAYASTYLDANIGQAWDIVICDTTGDWSFCRFPDPEDILGY